MQLHHDATMDCACGLPMFPVAFIGDSVRYECANRHVQVVPLPRERALRRRIQNWIDKSVQVEDAVRERRDEHRGGA